MLREPLNRALLSRGAKPLLLLLCLAPAGWLVYGAATDQLGANPAEALIRATGDWTLRMLCVVLAVTPLRLTFRLPGLARLRRMLGLAVYGYAVLHLLCYAWFDMGFELQDIAADIAKRPFILVGFTAIVLLTPLAATSWNGAIRWLGGPRWQALHRFVYAVAVLAVLHFFWMRAGKNDFAEVYVYAAVLGLLLGWRLWRAFSGQGRGAAVGHARVDDRAR
ncbi:MAG: protein-methionine-sulfoxide reductase heme-binding subunit MsrQ [Curvibacter sp.]